MPLIPAAGAGEVTNLGFAGKTYMQEITKSFCDSSSIAIGTEGRLIDNRDGKTYWVAKQKDGLCWMTQNLDYDGGGIRMPNPIFPNDTTTPRYYDPGEYVYTTPIAQNSCNSLDISSCKNWQDVQNYTPAEVSYFGGEIKNGQYNAHYLIGNYYNWLAATNGTGSSATTDGAQASGSICPAGWSLPTSNTTSTGSFGNLTSGLTASTTTTTNNIKLAPYYFVYGGLVNSSSLYYTGSEGYYWSSTARDASIAYSLAFYNTSVAPSNNILYRYDGFSVRCVAR